MAIIWGEAPGIPCPFVRENWSRTEPFSQRFTRAGALYLCGCPSLNPPPPPPPPPASTSHSSSFPFPPSSLFLSVSLSSSSFTLRPTLPAGLAVPITSHSVVRVTPGIMWWGWGPAFLCSACGDSPCTAVPLGERVKLGDSSRNLTVIHGCAT